MNTKLKNYIACLCLLFPCLINAQDNFQFGLLPVLNINKKLIQEYKLNFKTETRQVLYRQSDFDYKHELVDFSLILSKKTGLNNSLGLGYLIRVRDGEIINRAIEQFTITRKYSFFRVAHRFSMDQTFQADEATELRFRYRISNQFPLNGQSVDSREFYLKANNEYLNSFQGEDYDLEIRLTVMLGYEFSDDSKIEFGIDQRFDSFIKSKVRPRSWLGFAWYLAM